MSYSRTSSDNNKYSFNVAHIGAFILLAHILITLSVTFFNNGSFALQHAEWVFSPPSQQFWLGTDGLGRDVLARTLMGGRDTIFVSLFATLLSMLTGIMVGMTTGVRGGLFDELVMRTVDGLRTIPWILPVLLIISFYGQSLWLIVLVLGVLDGIDTTRVIRSATLSVVAQEYIVSARLRGESSVTLFIHELIPNITHVITVETAMRYSWMLLRFSSLSFLGFGTMPPFPDWGMMISESAPYISLAPWASLAPAFALCSLVVAANLAAGLVAPQKTQVF